MQMIGILTFYWADDYGALLQCYALKAYLSRFDRTVVVPYYPRTLRSRYRILRYRDNDKLKWKMRTIGRQLSTVEFYSRLVAKLRMASFRWRFLTGDFRKLDSAAKISTYWQGINTYVVGSDQVWNPEITEGFQEGYFCEFPKFRGVCCIAYGASIGSVRLNKFYDAALAGYLGNFDAVSVREFASAAYIGSLYGKEPETVVDPVFLLKKKEWERFLKNKGSSSKRYIAVYDTEYNEEMAGCIADLSEKLKLPVVVLRAERRNYDWGKKEEYVWGCGPLEFLEHLYHAEYVITNSFHGTAMAIIFHKLFVAFPHSERNIRLKGLLHAAGLENRMAHTILEGTLVVDQVDWAQVDKALQKEIERSKVFIKKEILMSH